MSAEPKQAPSSANHPRLKQALQKYPAADVNKDGVLTLEEARAFQKKHALARGGQADKQGAVVMAEAPEGGEKHIYKTIELKGKKLEMPLYFYGVKGAKPGAKAPAVVFFFGGGWKNGSPKQFEAQCKHLAEQGVVGITVEYRVSSRVPGNKVEDCIEDAKSAMRWVRSNAAKLGIDPARIASAGGSAGGHLAACVALMDDFNAATDDLKVSPKPNAMILFNPALGSAEAKEAAAKRMADRLRGPVEKAMPLTYASKKQPPCIMFFGTKDGLLAGAQAHCEASKKAGNQCKIVTYEGQGHGFFNQRGGNDKYYKATLGETEKFLTELGWLKAVK